MKSVLQDWVMNLGLRHQGVLVSAMRGCDTVSRDSEVKFLARCLRAEVLNAFVGDPKKSKSYIQVVHAEELLRRMNAVVKDHDELPHHYLMHLIHAAEIVGYCSPSVQAAYWCGFYVSMVNKLHMNVETAVELDLRLNADEETFAKNQ